VRSVSPCRTAHAGDLAARVRIERDRRRFIEQRHAQRRRTIYDRHALEPTHVPSFVELQHDRLARVRMDLEATLRVGDAELAPILLHADVRERGTIGVEDGTGDARRRVGLDRPVGVVSRLGEARQARTGNRREQDHGQRNRRALHVVRDRAQTPPIQRLAANAALAVSDDDARRMVATAIAALASSNLVPLVPMADAPKPRLLTGDRPTGPLHLGHLVGSLDNRVALQHDHECFIIVADLHTLTTRPRKHEFGEVPAFVRQIVLDQLAVGLDPEKVTFYLQSGVPAVYDLTILLQMLVPKARLEQVKSLRSMARAAAMPDDAMTIGLLAYPVLQAADILMARATIVPVGLDNEEHIMIARECATVFNELYGDLFPLPEARISTSPALPGVGTGAAGSGAKMSKSLGNAVYLGDSPDEVRAKIATLEHGDGDRRLGDDAPLVAYARAFVGADGASELRRDLDAGTITVGAAHALVTDAIEKRLTPIRSRHAELAASLGLVEEILVDGTIRAREVANNTLQRTREAMGLEALWSGLVSATEARAKARRRPY